MNTPWPHKTGEIVLALQAISEANPDVIAGQGARLNDNGLHARQPNATNRSVGYMLQDVATMLEVAELALDLAENERAMLAANLLDSLPATLSEPDEGIAEALRRDAYLDAHPHEGISAEELESQIRHRAKPPNRQGHIPCKRVAFGAPISIDFPTTSSFASSRIEFAS